MASRADRAPLRSIGLFSNRLLLWGIAFELVFAATVVYFPPLQTAFGTRSLALVDLLFIAPFPFIVWGADELRRARQRGRNPVRRNGRAACGYLRMASDPRRPKMDSMDSSHVPVLDAAYPPVFPRLLCAINGSRGSAEAVRQALSLATPGTAVTFVAITDERGVGANRVAVVGEHRARQALAAAKALAADMRVTATTELVHAGKAAETLLSLQPEHDVLVIGCPGRSRLGDMLIGNVATVLAHRTHGPLLIARASALPESFPQQILVAVDDRRRSRRQVTLAARLARASHAHVHLAHVTGRDYDARTRRLLAELSVEVRELTGTEPLVDTLEGPTADALAHEVDRVGADLLILGRRGVSGVKALGSVSERLVHSARCSVLIAGADK